MPEQLSAVVVAAGRSQRMGFDKLLTPLAGKPLLLHTLSRLQDSPHVREIVLVIRPDVEAAVAELIAPLPQKSPIRLVHGGEKRQDSVQAGLKAVLPDSNYVLIHDAARPCINNEVVDLVYRAAQAEGAAVCGTPSSDTLKEVTDEGTVYQTIERSKIWTVQTPQIFRKQLLLDAYAAVLKEETHITDDTAAVEHFGQPVRVILYHGVNFKVTTPADWRLAAAYLAMGEGSCPAGLEMRRLMHDMNNHLTPLLGYAFLLGNEFAPDTKGKKYADNIHISAEKCHQVSLDLQKIIRDLFPKEKEASVIASPS